MTINTQYNEALLGLCDDDTPAATTIKTGPEGTKPHSEDNETLNVAPEKVANTSVGSFANQRVNLGWLGNFLLGEKDKYNASKYNNDVHANQDLVKNAPFGQGNKLSYDETLQRQRDLDAFNNQLWLKPVSVGYRTNGSFGSTGAPGIGELYKQSPLETEEARQMQINRNLEQYLRQRGITRAEDIRDYMVEFQKNNDRALNTLALQTGTNNAAVEKALQDAIISVGFTVPQTQRITAIANAFAQQLYANNKATETWYIKNIFENVNKEWADKLMGALSIGQVPNMEDLLMQKELDPLFNDYNAGKIDRATVARVMQGILNTLSLAKAGSIANAYTDVLNAGIGGLAKGAR